MWITAVAVLCCFCLPGVQGDKIDDADRAAGQGNFPLAISRFLEAIDESTTIADKAYAYAGIANCYTGMKAFSQAGDAYRQAGSVQCKPEFFFNAGMAYTEQTQVDNSNNGSGRWEESALDSYKACTQCPGNVRPCWVKVAQIYRNRDSFEQTQDALITAIRLAPHIHDAYVHLGDVLNNRKFFGQAIGWYKQALGALSQARQAGMPDHLSLPALISVHNSLGHACSNSKKLDEAVTHYNMAKELSASLKLLMSTAGPDAAAAVDVPYLEALVGSYFSAQDLAIWRHHEADQKRLVELSAQLLLGSSSGSSVGKQGDVDSPLSPYRCMFLDSFSSSASSSTSVSVNELCANVSTAVSSKLLWRHSNQHQGKSQGQSFGTGTSNHGAAVSDIDAGVDTGIRSNDGKIPPPLRVGYISRRFTDYPGTQMMLRLFGAHSRRHDHNPRKDSLGEDTNSSSDSSSGVQVQVQVVAIASGPDDEIKGGVNETAYRRIIRESVGQFLDISLLPPTEAMAAVLALHLDVLVDYDGLHDFNNHQLLTQVRQEQLRRGGGSSPTLVLSWLGFAGPLGQSAHVSTLASSSSLAQQQHQQPHQGPTDYMLVDRHVIPPDTIFHHPHHHDVLVYLPTTYQPQDELSDSMLFTGTNSDVDSSRGSVSVEVAADGSTDHDQTDSSVNKDTEAVTMAEAAQLYGSLTSTVVTDQAERLLLRTHMLTKYLLSSSAPTVARGQWFICFNRMEKITPDVFADWMQILLGRGRARAGGRGRGNHGEGNGDKEGSGGPVYLVLQAGSPAIAQRLRAYALYHGLPTSRLILLPRLAKRDYSLLLGLADLFLDTRFYNAHTIATDAMYRQTPVLTLSGNSFASRVGASLNNAVDYHLCTNTNADSHSDSDSDSDNDNDSYSDRNTGNITSVVVSRDGASDADAGAMRFCASPLRIGALLLTTHSRKDYVDTAIRLAESDGSSSGGVLRQLRSRIHPQPPSSSTSLSTLTVTATATAAAAAAVTSTSSSSSIAGGRSGSLLFNSEHYARLLEHVYQAVHEPAASSSSYAINTDDDSAKVSKTRTRAGGRHIFFAGSI